MVCGLLFPLLLIDALHVILFELAIDGHPGADRVFDLQGIRYSYSVSCQFFFASCFQYDAMYQLRNGIFGTACLKVYFHIIWYMWHRQPPLTYFS